MEADKLCKCIKKVRRTVTARKGSTKEQAAIAICVKSVLHTRGKTVKKFSCGKTPKLTTQKRKKGGCACGAGKKRGRSICSCSPDVGDCPRCKVTS